MADFRVTGGEHRGRKLHRPKRAKNVRPTTGRTREAIFSILGPIDGAEVLDLFAGTGSLAIEAVSRGAASATAVDSDESIARANVKDLGLEDRVEVVRAEVQRFLERAEAGTYDLIFCDPPYTLARRLVEIEPLIATALAPNGRLVIETSAAEPARMDLPFITEKVYGDTMVRIYGAPAPAQIAKPAAGVTEVSTLGETA